jgi:hypothetical protein
LSFAAKHENGQNRAVRPFLTGSVALHCATGDLRRSYNLDVSIKVTRKDRFSRTVTLAPDEERPEQTTITIAGVFTHREQKAVGTLRAHATGAPFGDCDSGVVTWTTKGDTGSKPVGRAT